MPYLNYEIALLHFKEKKYDYVLNQLLRHEHDTKIKKQLKKLQKKHQLPKKQSKKLLLKKLLKKGAVQKKQ